MNPWVLLGTSLISMVACQMVESPGLKHGLWGTFTLTQGLSIASLVSMFSLPIVFNAAAATAAMVGALSFYAYNTPI